MAKFASPLREIRTRLGLSQSECAAALDVAVETFRTWDADRRPAPETIVRRAEALRAKRPPHARVRLQVLANELHVNVRTLRAAAKDGRLVATFSPRPYFGKLTVTATREAAARFMATWYRRMYGRGRRRLVSVCRVTVPANYAAQLIGLSLPPRPQSTTTGHKDRRGEQGRGLSMGNWEAEALARLLAADQAPSTPS
jgi:transcriptional regulator with XRE-family HTH domain